MSLKGGPGTALGRNIKDYASVAAGYSPWRDGAGLVHLNGLFYQLGGWNSSAPWSGSRVTNEVLSFNGSTWTLIHANDPSPSPATSFWSPRHTAGFLKHAHAGIDYVYVIGSDIFNGGGLGTSDVWRSPNPNDNDSWERMTNEAGWGPRVLHMAASFQGALYVMGGQPDGNSPNLAMRDVWKSTDGGVSFSQLADAGWSPRGLVYNPCEFAGRLWVCGGGKYDDSVPANSTFLNDVWSFDGQTWTQVAVSAPWGVRHFHSTLAFAGSLWVVNGHNGSADIADAWWTQDGDIWTRSPVVWIASHADSVASEGANLWLTAGNHGNTTATRVEVF